MNRTLRGLTLIEVLVALAIFSTAAISIMTSIAQHINTLSYLEEKTFASFIADNQISLAMLSGAPKSPIKGKTEMAGQEWYWKITPVKTEADFITAFDVSVLKTQDSESAIVTVRSYVEK